MSTAILLISCPDRRGITASVTDFVYRNNGNVEHADQHIDAQSGTFFMRIEWSLDNFNIHVAGVAAKFSPLARKFAMKWSFFLSDETPRVAVFVSRPTAVLQDLLLRYEAGQFRCVIPLVISNHPDAASIAERFGVEFFIFPKTKKNKLALEREELRLLRRHKIETVVLARYMQVLSHDFVRAFPNKIINIHHSFLPAFAGSRPYLQAYRRGVKIIGATSHYVNSVLDAGPIIEQDTVRVSHRDSLTDLEQKGEELEKIVLSRALRWHLERKVLVYNNKTVVFD
jgi:formyltetrahydrofolate deformylase